MHLSIKAQLEKIVAGTASVMPLNELEKKLKSGKTLSIKLGADPTAPDLHLGHLVVLQKMRDFQELGHQVIFIIGDFTTLIGDPTGKSKTRPPLQPEEIKQNAQTYFDQVFKILDKNKTKVLFNSEWLSKLSASDFLKLCSKTTLMRIIEREDFKNRMQSNISIGFHELLYPILQGYDSVELHADVELGGTDQTFNLLFGRHLQEEFCQEPQITITMPILEGLDGKEKMSKSLKNYVSLQDSPENVFGKLMSMPDTNIFRYHQVVLRKTEESLEEIKNKVIENPMQEKKNLAHEILTMFWGKNSADIGKKYFEEVFQKCNYEAALELKLPWSLQEHIWIVDVLKFAKITNSSSEAKRLIEGGSVFLNDIKITDFKEQVTIKASQILKVGKKIFNLTSFN